MGGGDLQTFEAFPNGTGTGTSVLAFGDAYDDGAVDAVIGTLSGSRLSYLPGRGNGGFGEAIPLSLPESHSSIVVADLDGNGRNDVVGSCDDA